MEKTSLFLEGFFKRAFELGMSDQEAEDLYHTYRLYKAEQLDPESFAKGLKEAQENVQTR